MNIDRLNRNQIGQRTFELVPGVSASAVAAASKGGVVEAGAQGELCAPVSGKALVQVATCRNACP